MASKQSEPVKNTGKPSENIFQDNLVGAVFRLRDAKDLTGLNGRKVTSFGLPSDFVCVTPNCMFFAEVKSSHNKTSFSYSCFQPAQKAAMARCMLATNTLRYYIFVHHVPTDQWYIISGNQLVKDIKAGKKSSKWGELKPLTSWIF